MPRWPRTPRSPRPPPPPPRRPSRWLRPRGGSPRCPPGGCGPRPAGCSPRSPGWAATPSPATRAAGSPEPRPGRPPPGGPAPHPSTTPSTYTQAPSWRLKRLFSRISPRRPRSVYSARNSTVPSVWNALPPVVPRISSRVQRTPGAGSTAGGRVSGCQLRSRYASSPTANALNRERINSSAVAARAAPLCSRPQHPGYPAPLPHGHDAGAGAAAGRDGLGREVLLPMRPLWGPVSRRPGPG
ncbi:protein of unknown function [Streptantibioticus cattleyicolor NRRL 8057 = DSM 46488]|nr:protein of unknown function [Streptantibioticus cattleyicolor NRRL 8057 = DSM 46488]